ncbi:hypothetical protein CEXT_390361 [Caerostris extrusa]|uniref:Uncharacterized protein n=1 Tax=Caerostris extrusa TaxID=172846 RepID=A0AAV4W5M6_CAEEX|nr:hypothetical protein CEXT_390361 [Caerostris extrusa]
MRVTEKYPSSLKILACSDISVFFSSPHPLVSSCVKQNENNFSELQSVLLSSLFLASAVHEVAVAVITCNRRASLFFLSQRTFLDFEYSESVRFECQTILLLSEESFLRT